MKIKKVIEFDNACMHPTVSLKFSDYSKQYTSMYEYVY